MYTNVPSKYPIVSASNVLHKESKYIILYNVPEFFRLIAVLRLNAFNSIFNLWWLLLLIV